MWGKCKIGVGESGDQCKHRYRCKYLQKCKLRLMTMLPSGKEVTIMKLSPEELELVSELRDLKGSNNTNEILKGLSEISPELAKVLKDYFNEE